MNQLYGTVVALVLLASGVYAETQNAGRLVDLAGGIGIATGYLGVSLLAAHLAAPEAYSAEAHTISHLGAQGYDRAWIMNAGLVGFGGGIAASSLAHSIRARQNWPTIVPLAVYGLGILASGIWSTSPFIEGVGYAAGEAAIHSAAAQVAGVGISIASVSVLITEPIPSRKVIHGLAVLFIGATSAMVGLSPEHPGTWQRILWSGSLVWLNWALATDPRFRRGKERHGR